MSLTKADLNAIKRLFDTSFDERVPEIIDERVPAIIDQRVQPMLDKLEERLTRKIDELTLDIGQFSLETTNNFYDLERRMSDKIDEVGLRLSNKIDEVNTRLGDKVDEVGDKLNVATDMSDANRVEVAKMKRKLGLT